MRTLRVLFSAKFSILAAVLFDRRRKYIIRNIAMIIILSVMVAASYFFFYYLIFRYLTNIEDIGFLLIDRLVTVGFLIFFFMLVVSSFIISLGSLFRSRETEYLFSTPVSVAELFTSKFFDIIVFSSWTILIMAIPILYAYAKVREFGTIEYALTGVVILLPFVLIADSIGTLLAILAKHASKRINIKLLVVLGAACFALFIYLVIRFSQPTQLKIQFTEDFRALNLFINSFQLNANPFTPNFWFIQSLRSLVLHNYQKLALYAFALISTAAFSLSLLYVCVDRIYFTTWLSSLEQSAAGASSTAVSAGLLTNILSRPTRSQMRAIISKDIRLFMREVGQWAQLLLIVALLALYFVNLYFIPKDIEIEQWRTILFIMNFGFCGFVLATLAVRFVFPSISLEGDSFWVLCSSPLSMTTLFKGKFLLSFAVFLVVAETLGFVSSTLLQLEEFYRIITYSGIFFMSITLSCIALGFGATFPDFSERNPSKIVSSPGGILTVVISMLYIALMVALLAIPSYKYTLFLIAGGDFPRTELIVTLGSVLVINAVMIIAPLYFGLTSFSRREF